MTASQLASASVRPLRRSRRIGLALGLALGLGAVPTAFADEAGTPGRLVSLSIHTPGSDDSSIAHGSIMVRKGSGKPELYQWGGTACPASKLSDTQINILAQAFHNRARTLVTPRFKQGDVKDVRCLVGFELAAG